MNNTNTVNNDEIDLIELIKVLWDKKIWILLSAFVCTLIAGVYAFTAKEQWTSKAEVIAPKMIDLGNYFTFRKEYARILNQPFDSSALQSHLFSNFNLFSASLDVRKDFFQTSEYYQKLIEGKSEQEQRKILTDLITKNIVITKPDNKKEPDLIGRRISFSAETAIDARDVLAQFIRFTSQLSLKLELDDFLANFNEVVADLRFEKSKLENDLVIQKNVQLANLENALGMAKEAGIQDYTKSFSSTDSSLAVQAIAMSETKIPFSDSKLSDSSYLFMLGEKYLKAQIDVLKQSSIVYSPRYYEVSTLLSQLEPLLAKTKDVKANAFSYQASPDYPVVRDKPRILLILIGALLIGTILSILFILTKEFYKGKK